MNAANSQDNKRGLLDEFNAVVTETEHLLKSLTTEGGEKATALRANLEKNLKAARERLGSLEQAVVQKTKATVQTTDSYVHEHPWQAIGIAAGLGIVLGMLMSRR
jgi:ElaB/YqjD/DUF883 family membrane-anchored ribosome-binding protein